MPTEYTVEIAGTEYPWVDIRYVRDYKFYGKMIEVIIPEWIAEIAGDDAIVIKRDGETVTSGTVKKITPFEGVGKGMGMTVKGYTKEQKHATLLVPSRTYNDDPHNIVFYCLAGSDLTDGTTNMYGSSIVVEFGTNDESKFSRKMVYEEVAFITGWELYASPTGALDFKSQCGVDRSAAVLFRHGELLESWHEPHMVNYLVKKTKVIVLGALEQEFEFYGITGAGSNVLTIERKNLIDDNTCELASAALYADMQNALQAGVMNVIDTYEGAAYDVYDTVRIEDDRFGLAADMRIYRIERHVNKDGEHTKIFYTNITKLTSNGRYLLDLEKEYLGKGQRVLRDFGRTAVNVIDTRALDGTGKVDFSVIYVTNKGHVYLSGVGSGDHHNKSHKERHETGATDPLDTSSDGVHGHMMYTHTFYCIETYDTKYAHASSDPESALESFSAPTYVWQWTGASEVYDSGGHTHPVTSSPSPYVMDAEEGEEMIIILKDEIIPDGRRHVKVNFPEFISILDVVYPIGSTDEKVIKDIKYQYHRTWTLKKAGKLHSEPMPGALKGKKLKWDRKQEEIDMAAKLAETGEEEREENERRRLGRVAEELEKEKK